MNVADIVKQTAARLPDKPALIFQDKPITYGELEREIDQAAAGIASLGIRKGDRVGVLVQNVPHFIYAYLGIERAGGVMVPLNTMYTADEVSYILADAEARAVVVAEPFLRAVDGLRETLPMLEHVVVVGGGSPIGTMGWDQMTGRGQGAPSVTIDDGDLAALPYTSGTTGKPKGAMLTHGNLMANIEQMHRVPLLTEAETDVVLLVLPMFHIYALNVSLGLTFRVGATAVLQERFDPVASLDAIERHGITVLFGAPPMFVAWLSTPNVEKRNLSSVRLAVSGAAPLPGPVLEDFKRRLGITIWEGYGLTETAPGVTSNAMGSDAKPGSIGKPLPDVELRLLDEQGDEVEEGDPGEIVVRGPNVFKGYWHDDPATEEATRGGWFHTGDVAYEDEDGYLFLVDRKKDLIIVSGFNVYPREVEEALYRHPKVAEAAVVGIPHPYTGEAVKAVVVLKPGTTATEEEIIEFCKRSIARFKCPQVVEFVDKLPHTDTGKILRRRLREDDEQPAEEPA
ncbi:MAG TPA: long-chain fatty acid--CoA ligase [Actinomycetota bacterium]|nr:long-chain fatty acid--CoA ligase [Actinomycetota bacterium]